MSSSHRPYHDISGDDGDKAMRSNRKRSRYDSDGDRRRRRSHGRHDYEDDYDRNDEKRIHRYDSDEGMVEDNDRRRRSKSSRRSRREAEEEEEDYRRHRKRNRRKRSGSSSGGGKSDRKRKESRRRRREDSDDESADSDDADGERVKRKRRKSSKKRRRKPSKRTSSSSSSSSETDSDEELNDDERRIKIQQKERVLKEALGYSNDSNPFGDSNLTQKFVWKKRQETIPKEQREEEKRRKREGKQEEVLQLRERRLNRERERREWEAEKERLMREQELENMEGWEQKEEEFHLKQAQKRSEIRIREGRAKPIDLIADNLKILDPNFGKPSDDLMDDLMRDGEPFKVADVDIETREPYKVFDGLTLREMEDLQRDIAMYLELDHANRTFWIAMETVCQHELNDLRARQHQEQSRHGSSAPVVSSVRPLHSTDPGIHNAVRKEISRVFVGKSHEELNKMQQEIERTLENPDGGVDTEYWDSLLKELKIFKARALLRKVHMHVLDKYLKMLREEEEEAVATELEKNAATEGDEMQRKQDMVERLKRSHGREGGEQHGQRAHSEEDRSADDALLHRVAGRHNKEVDEGMVEEGEVDDVFADEVQLFAQEYSWNDKYRPRKPRSFNRILTGYEWSKYNSVHYDKDNPPPKVVQGYRFNIFYPDLIDKSKPPTFFLEKDGNSRETAILRFHAGPPYEDIAFRIVNREWEKNHRRGYRCVWDRGVLQLHFRFRRYRYRR